MSERLRFDKVQAVLAEDATAQATTLTFEEPLAGAAGALPTVADEQVLAVVVDDEIVHVTSYASGATTATVARGREGTTAVAHPAGTTCVHGPTAADFAVEVPPDSAATVSVRGGLLGGSNTGAAGNAAGGRVAQQVLLSADAEVVAVDVWAHDQIGAGVVVGLAASAGGGGVQWLAHATGTGAPPGTWMRVHLPSRVPVPVGAVWVVATGTVAPLGIANGTLEHDGPMATVGGMLMGDDLGGQSEARLQFRLVAVDGPNAWALLTGQVLVVAEVRTTGPGSTVLDTPIDLGMAVYDPVVFYSWSTPSADPTIECSGGVTWTPPSSAPGVPVTGFRPHLRAWGDSMEDPSNEVVVSHWFTVMGRRDVGGPS